MNEKDSTYRVPEGFHPLVCMDTIRGLADAIHQYMFEGKGTRRIPARADQDGLAALIALLQKHVHQLHAWLIEIENSTSLKLPLTDADFDTLREKLSGKDEVRDGATIYTIQ